MVSLLAPRWTCCAALSRAGQFDLVYGSGCFHHIAPHRRITYFECVPPTERPGGRFGIAPLHAIELRAVHSDCEGAFGDFLNAGR